MSKQRVAVAGAGQLGVPLTKSLLNAGFKVTILTRSTALPSEASLPTDNADLSCATVDYNSIQSLTSALKDHFAVVSTLATASLAQQQALIDAALAAGVTRFLPSEYGCNTADQSTGQLAVFAHKASGQKSLAEKAAQHPNFSYSVLLTGPWFDNGITQGYILDVKNRKGTYYDGGDTRISTTTLKTVVRAITAILMPANLEKTKNRAVYIHDTIVTQNQIIDLANKNTGASMKDWNLEPASTEELKGIAEESLSKGPDSSALTKLIRVAIFGGENYGGDFSRIGTDNELLGLPVMSEKEVEDVVKSAL